MGRQVVVLAALLVASSLTPVPCGAAGIPLVPQAEEINRRQTQDLRREQRLYRERIPQVSPPEAAQILDRQRMELEHQRQLQQRERARIKQLEQIEMPGGRQRTDGRHELQRLRREQESQRLNFRMRRRTPGVR